ncbi:unnamed protein product [Eruca vesicaria subsp. sativa]|uniref:DUF3527 domain protein n=1 Tax=Eruca vesicaria subsp. sativa TaxID=29727 RepID=A0ABC8LAG1_ERUVS|nr:unnamed protein product [Eruca vesicaria subsp. sativa]
MYEMATRSDLRGLFKQSQKKSSADAISPSAAQTNEIGRHSRKESSDEVVKYMSKLPGYLQGDDESNGVLNVGVLDWSRLEKWKHGRAKGADTKVSSTTLATLPNASSHQVHACSNLRKVKASRDLHHSVHGVRCTLEPELASSSSSRDCLNKQEIATCSNKSSARDQERVKNPGKSRISRSNRELASSGLLSTMGNSGGSLGAKGSFVAREKETEMRARKAHAQEARERATESLKQCTEKLDGEEKIVRDLDAGLTSQNHQVSNIILLRSRKQSPSTLSSEPHMDDNPKVAREVNRSLDFSSLGLRSQVPRSCPLSFDLEIDSEDMKLPLLGVAKKERSGGTTRHSKTASSMFDQEIRQLKNIEPSPSKRFSFSFGRLSRSFTFKEDSSSAAQPLTSSSDDTIKSDLFDSSACPSQSSNPEKQNNHGGSRVSPLIRLLDPLLKHKVSENVLPSEARSSSFNQDEKKKQDASRTQALLQLTIRNGIPLFQFVVDDDNLKSRRSILGATMKSSDSSVKDDSVQYCTFYSVNEAKKKKSGSWLIHGHKEKQQHRFVYNVIGEMRLCNTDNVSSVIRESVLVDESEQVLQEVAAVVIKKKPAEETTVILTGGDHSIPEKGAPTPLISRWRSGGCCDCGGWDVGCKLHVLSSKTFLHDLDQTFQLFYQDEESDKNSGPVLAMTEVKTGIYSVEFGSFLSHLQAFFVCVTVITCASEEETVSKTTGKSSSPFAPPLSPVGRA